MKERTLALWRCWSGQRAARQETPRCTVSSGRLTWTARSSQSRQRQGRRRTFEALLRWGVAARRHRARHAGKEGKRLLRLREITRHRGQLAPMRQAYQLFDEKDRDANSFLTLLLGNTYHTNSCHLSRPSISGGSIPSRISSKDNARRLASLDRAALGGCSLR